MYTLRLGLLTKIQNSILVIRLKIFLFNNINIENLQVFESRTMNNEQVTKEIKDRLNKVCNLLKEIEDILCEDKIEGQLSKDDYACICICEKHSIPEVLEPLSNNIKADNRNKCEEMQQLHTCSEKNVKCKDLGGEKNFYDVNDIIPCCRRINKQNHIKNNSKYTNDLCCNTSNKQAYNNTQNDCMHEQFKNKINYIKQKYMLYFDEINKNEIDKDNIDLKK